MEINQLINDLHHVNSELKQRTERINQLESKEELLFEIYKKTKILDNLKRQLLISTDKKENAKYTMDAIRDKVDSMAENFKSDATALIELKKEIFRNLGLKIWMKPIENNDDLWEIKVFYSESTLYYVVLQYFVPSDSFELISMNPTPPKFDEIKQCLSLTNDYKGFLTGCREFFIKHTIAQHTNK